VGIILSVVGKCRAKTGRVNARIHSGFFAISKFKGKVPRQDPGIPVHVGFHFSAHIAGFLGSEQHVKFHDTVFLGGGVRATRIHTQVEH
jgi:hypothetical protein